MKLPLIISPQQVSDAQGSTVKIVDLRPFEAYSEGHIPGAIHLDTALLGRAEPPTAGLLPDDAGVKNLAHAIGLQANDQIIAYDNGAGSAAARLTWVLHAYGFNAVSWLNGGFTHWVAKGLEISTDVETAPNSSDAALTFTADNVLSVKALAEQLDDQNLAILDVRSTGEYEGTDVRSARGGHVPNAKHSEWTNAFESTGQLKKDAELIEMLEELDINRKQHVIVYCQTHQRSALTYVVLKHLGYKKVSAIDGAWSAWGNNPDVPVETGAAKN